MAKRNRNTTALFEVMSPGKKSESIASKRRVFQSPPFFKSFKWPSMPSLPSIPSISLSKSMFKRERHEPVEVSPPIEIPIETVRPGIKKRAVEEPGNELFADLPDVTFDPEPTYHEPAISLKIDWLNSAIVVSGVVILVGVAVLIERHFTHVKPMLLSTTATAHQQSVQPSVLDLSQETGPILTQDKTRQTSATPPPAEKRATNPADASRTLNLNYLVMQRYNDTKTAHDAADFLNKAGVACDVVKGLPRMAANPEWFYVVGNKGFGPHCRGSAELTAYLEEIHKASLQFAGKTKWKQFDPILYRWDDAAAKVATGN